MYMPTNYLIIIKLDYCVQGLKSTAMIDTGASISVIDKSFLEKINLTYCVDSNRQILCKLADGTTITLDKKIVLPIKFNNITIEADLFILPMNHVRIIIGCDLLHLLNARIDFSSNTLMLQKPLPIKNITNNFISVYNYCILIIMLFRIFNYCYLDTTL